MKSSWMRGGWLALFTGLATLTFGFVGFAGALDNAILAGQCDKDALSYRPGEEMVFRLVLDKVEGPVPEGEYRIRWRVTGDDGSVTNGIAPILARPEPLVIRTSLSKPGFVRVNAYVIGKDGRHFLKPGKRLYYDTGIEFDGGAAVEPEKLEAVPEPADFDAFWKDRRAELDAVPFDVTACREPVRTSAGGPLGFRVAIPCAGGRPVTSYLYLPRDASATKRYPARAVFDGYGVYNPRVVWNGEGGGKEIVLHINAHGAPLGLADADFDAWAAQHVQPKDAKGLDRYALSADEHRSPTNAYFLGMAYRVQRAMDYLKALPEWNGTDLTASGGSQGGMQSVWAAGLDAAVTRLEILVPWCCNIGGHDVQGRNRKNWGVQWTSAMGYFDTVNFGKRVARNAVAVISRAGLGDYTCPPEGVACLYNALPCRKSITWIQASTHPFTPRWPHRKDFTFAVTELEGELALKPTFVSCGVSYGTKEALPEAALAWRKRGGTWRSLTGVHFPFFRRNAAYRASLVDLEENADYEVRILSQGKVLAAATFRTWSSAVTVAKTVTLGKATRFPVRIADKGTPGGWIRYVPEPGFELDYRDDASPAFVLDGAEHVILDGFTVRGSGARSIITLSDTRAVRILNCDLSRWGRTGMPKFDDSGMLYDAKGDLVNFDGAIAIGAGARDTVIERCWIHDPRGRANSWFYSHPAGPEAVVAGIPCEGTVIRWCDFTGSDAHRFNDCVESLGNFDADGGLNRDSDVYGNFMAFANDDCIELDGGQRNVRCFDNRFESALVGVSVQGCMMGPSYVMRNAFTSMCEEFGMAGQTVKTGGGDHGPDARTFVEKNLFWGKGTGIVMMPTLSAVVRDNVFCGGQAIARLSESPRSTSERNVLGATVAEAELDPGIPRRPVPFLLDRVRFSGITVVAGHVTPTTLTFKASCAKDAAAPVPFTVVKPADMDWFTVAPAAGTLAPGEERSFTVSLDAQKMGGRRQYRGVFLVRTPDGLSRAVTLYAETDFVPPYRAEKPGDVALYAPEATAGVFRALDKGRPLEFTFDVPKAGRYYPMIHAKTWGWIDVSVDGGAFVPSRQENAAHPFWTLLTTDTKTLHGGGRHCWLDLTAGRHVIRLRQNRGGLVLDGLVLTDNPLSFEPK